MELVGGILLGYSALLVDALASAFDVIASLAIVLAIHLAARPPDKQHPFGHGRFEPLAGLQLGLFVCGAGLWVAFEQIRGAVQSPPAADIRYWAWLIPAAAAAILEVSARIVRRIGERLYGRGGKHRG